MAPATTVCAEPWITVTRRSLSCQIVRNPAEVSAKNPSASPADSAIASPMVSGSAASSFSASALLTWMPDTISIDQRNDTTLRRKTSSTSATTRRPAPRAGPMKIARLSRVLEVPLEAVSSSVVFASWGVIAPWAARKDEPPKEVRVASTNTGHAGVSAYRQMVAAAISTAQ